MKSFVLPFFLFLLSTLPVMGQQSTFPESWVGEYSGEMILAQAVRPNDTIPVDFNFTELIEDSLWTYRMTYHSDKFGEITKDYLIRSAVKGDKKNFELDEQNGIIMELTLMNNTFFGMYNVMGDIYSISLRLQENGLFFELYAASVDGARLSEVPGDNDDTIVAKSYKPKLVQSVVLTRK